MRGVPVRTVETVDGPVLVTTVYDLLMAQFGVGRGLAGDYPASYDDAGAPYTPAWQERFTGVIARRGDPVRPRVGAPPPRRPAASASIIIGAGVNHWYHNNLIYRAAIPRCCSAAAWGGTAAA